MQSIRRAVPCQQQIDNSRKILENKFKISIASVCCCLIWPFYMKNLSFLLFALILSKVYLIWSWYLPMDDSSGTFEQTKTIVHVKGFHVFHIESHFFISKHKLMKRCVLFWLIGLSTSLVCFFSFKGKTEII